MSRIKGAYKFCDGRGAMVRWLDPATGTTHNQESVDSPTGHGFLRLSDGTWTNSYYKFTPDPPDTSWVAVSTVCGYCSKPGSYEDAKVTAEKLAAAFSQPYSVVQILTGNTVQIQPPEPVAVWS